MNTNGRTRPSLALRLRYRVATAGLNRDRGQTTAEYALVLLAAGTIAMLVVAWAQNNDAIGGLLDSVIERVTSLMA